MVENVAVFCAGPQTRIIIDILKFQSEFNIVGVVDSQLEVGSNFYGHKVIGRQNNLNELSKAYNFESGIVGLGDNYLREKIVNEIIKQKPNFNFINAISEFSYVSPTAQMGVGNLIMSGAIINSEAKILNHCGIYSNGTLEHNCLMSNFSSISAGVTTGGYVTIGRYSAICLGVTVLDRVTLGENVVVGSGSLVTKDLSSNGLFYGNPAKKIRSRKPFEKFLK